MEKLFLNAIARYDPKAALRYLNEGADPNAKNDDNESALQIALDHIDVSDEARQQSGELILALVQKGANTKSAKICRMLLESQLQFPVLKTIFESAKIIFPKGNLLSTFINDDFEADYQLKVIELIQQHGYKLDSDEMGKSMADFFPACAFGLGGHGRRFEIRDIALPVFQYLLDHGADINAKSRRDGHTPLMRAAMNSCPEICEYMLDNGADPDIQSNKGYTALMFVSGEIYKEPIWSVSEEDIETAKILLSYGADRSLKSNGNRAAESYAKSSDNHAVIKLLQSDQGYATKHPSRVTNKEQGRNLNGEDSLTVEFKSANLKDKKARAKLEKIYRTHVPHDDSAESSMEYTDERAKYFHSFFSPDNATLKRLLLKLEKGGAEELVATAWYDQAGESTTFTLEDGKLLDFESRAAMNDYLEEARKKRAAIRFDYGKKSKVNTILIRFQVKAKGKRKKLYDLFAGLLESLDMEGFKEQFATAINSHGHDVEWCRFRWKGGGKWYKTCHDDLASAMTDVQEIDEYIYLAYDLDRIEERNRDIDNFIYLTFLSLDGVNKVWVKYRPKGRRDLYLYQPGMGDEAYFVEKKIKEDIDWPKV